MLLKLHRKEVNGAKGTKRKEQRHRDDVVGSAFGRIRSREVTVVGHRPGEAGRMSFETPGSRGVCPGGGRGWRRAIGLGICQRDGVVAQGTNTLVLTQCFSASCA